MKRAVLAIVASAGFLLYSGVVPVTAAAQSAESTGFPFLRLDPSARSAALSGAVVSLFGADVNALYYNPSLLAEGTDGALSLSYLNHVADLRSGVLVYGREIPSIGSLAAGIRYMSWGKLQGATETGERTGEFGAGDFALTVGGSRAYTERVRIGASVHVVYSGIESYSASALAADLGVTYRIEQSGFAASASLNNFGATLSSFGNTRDRLPTDLRIGVAKRLANVPLLLTVMGYNLNREDKGADGSGTANDILRHVAVGGEFQFSDAFQIRIGYNHRQHEELKSKSRLDFAGFGFGAGIMIRGFRFDYAYNSWSEIGGLNRLTVGTNL
ncbi:MAG: type IX secretion system protein PorQ [Bacteroidetes bacterium]|nr:type IX secretion system protein PorQ [Bacteroidota bacterium]